MPPSVYPAQSIPPWIPNNICAHSAVSIIGTKACFRRKEIPSSRNRAKGSVYRLSCEQKIVYACKRECLAAVVRFSTHCQWLQIFGERNIMLSWSWSNNVSLLQTWWLLTKICWSGNTKSNSYQTRFRPNVAFLQSTTQRLFTNTACVQGCNEGCKGGTIP